MCKCILQLTYAYVCMEMSGISMHIPFESMNPSVYEDKKLHKYIAFDYLFERSHTTVYA